MQMIDLFDIFFNKLFLRSGKAFFIFLSGYGTELCRPGPFPPDPHPQLSNQVHF